MVEWRRLIYQGVDCGDFYLISSEGQIKSVKTGRIRKWCVNATCPYYFCQLSFGRSSHFVRVHRALAETFIPNPENKPIVNHKDGNKLNLALSNLEWATYGENNVHAIDTGLHRQVHGSDCGQSRLTEDDVKWAKSVFIPGHKDYGYRGLARQLGVSYSAIRFAIRGESWSHVK